MRPRLPRNRPSHATVVAYIALFAAVGTGGAYAANTIRSEDIVNGEVKRADIGGNAVTADELDTFAVGTAELATKGVTSSKLADASVGGRAVANNSLTGGDVLESGLGKVPDADKFDGEDSTQFQRVGLIHFGTAPQAETFPDTVIQWNDLGVKFTTDGDTDADRTLLITNFGSQDIIVVYDGAQTRLSSGDSTSPISVADLETFLVWPVDGLRSWLVTCVDESQILGVGKDDIRCHGVASRVG